MKMLSDQVAAILSEPQCVNIPSHIGASFDIIFAGSPNKHRNKQYNGDGIR